MDAICVELRCSKDSDALIKVLGVAWHENTIYNKFRADYHTNFKIYSSSPSIFPSPTCLSRRLGRQGLLPLIREHKLLTLRDVERKPQPATCYQEGTLSTMKFGVFIS